MEIAVKKSKVSHSFRFSGTYSNEDYQIVVQHFADATMIGDKNVKIDFSEVDGNSYKLINLILVLATNLRECKSVEFTLNEKIEQVSVWFEPVWSSLIQIGKEK